MALTFLPDALVIESDGSITDLPAFHLALRDWEDSAEAAVYPVTHTWKALDLGGGAFFYGLELTNGWRLRFPVPGNYIVVGNLGGQIIPVAGVYVERKTSAAFTTTSVGAEGASPELIAAAVRNELSTELTRLMEIARLQGLIQGTPLVVTQTSRIAGDIEQSIEQVDADTVRVERL